jgi:hypothetical protein
MRPRLFGLLVRSHGIAVLRELIDHMRRSHVAHHAFSPPRTY